MFFVFKWEIVSVCAKSWIQTYKCMLRRGLEAWSLPSLLHLPSLLLSSLSPLSSIPPPSLHFTSVLFRVGWTGCVALECVILACIVLSYIVSCLLHGVLFGFLVVLYFGCVVVTLFFLYYCCFVFTIFLCCVCLLLSLHCCVVLCCCCCWYRDCVLLFYCAG